MQFYSVPSDASIRTSELFLHQKNLLVMIKTTSKRLLKLRFFLYKHTDHRVKTFPLNYYNSSYLLFGLWMPTKMLLDIENRENKNYLEMEILQIELIMNADDESFQGCLPSSIHLLTVQVHCPGPGWFYLTKQSLKYFLIIFPMRLTITLPQYILPPW